MPDLTKESVKFFLEELRKEAEGGVALVWDRAGAHRAVEGEVPEGITLVFLPSYSPELNPVEQVRKALRKELAERIFETLEELEEAVCEALREFWEQPGGADLADGLSPAAGGAARMTRLTEISMTPPERRLVNVGIALIDSEKITLSYERSNGRPPPSCWSGVGEIGWRTTLSCPRSRAST